MGSTCEGVLSPRRFCSCCSLVAAARMQPNRDDESEIRPFWSGSTISVSIVRRPRPPTAQPRQRASEISWWSMPDSTESRHRVRFVRGRNLWTPDLPFRGYIQAGLSE